MKRLAAVAAAATLLAVGCASSSGAEAPADPTEQTIMVGGYEVTSKCDENGFRIYVKEYGGLAVIADPGCRR